MTTLHDIRLPSTETQGSSVKRFLIRTIISIVIVISFFFCYDFAQWQMVDSCKRASFFFYAKEEFECLPYTKGMLEQENRPHVQPVMPPQ